MIGCEETCFSLSFLISSFAVSVVPQFSNLKIFSATVCLLSQRGTHPKKNIKYQV